MAPIRAVAIRCCGPFFVPFFHPTIPPGSALFFPFQGGISTQKHHQNDPGISPKILPIEADFFAKMAIKSSDIALKISPTAPLVSPQANPRSTSRAIEIY